jgi:hypothetical protein
MFINCLTGIIQTNMKQGTPVAFRAGNIDICYTPLVPNEIHKWTINRQVNNLTFKDSKRQSCTIRRNIAGKSSSERLMEILIDKHPEFNISLTQEQVKALLPIMQKFAQTGKL